MTLNCNHRLPFKLTYNVSYLRIPFSTEDNHHATEIVDAAARNLRRPPPANTSKMQLRPNTSSQRKAQPLFTSYLPDIVTSYNSPDRKTQKQSGIKLKETPSQKRKTHHQK